MKNLYARLAVSGIAKNKKIYYPYILSCVGAVMVQYIVEFLSSSQTIRNIPQGHNVQLLLTLGKFVIAFFALIFLNYTNSFLIKRRNMEFGLYNVLGMDKKGITRIILWEFIIVTGISIVFGISFGIFFSKAAELVLLYLLNTPGDFVFSVSLRSLLTTLIIFTVIFIILLLNSCIKVFRYDILTLINSEKSRDKPVKANWLIAATGLVILIRAYYIAVSVKTPMKALFIFMIAVIMVIIATYMLFISGSVAFCRLLQKNRKFYYNKKNFVSVSSMVYRMNRNGNGLASICILSTMVLVMICSSASLYFGADESLSTNYPRNNMISVSFESLDEMSDEVIGPVEKNFDSVFEEMNVEPENMYTFRYATLSGLITEKNIKLDADESADSLSGMDNIVQVYFTTEEEYNRITGESISLGEGEAVICTEGCSYDKEKLILNDLSLNITGRCSGFPDTCTINFSVTPNVYVVIKDFRQIKRLEDYYDYTGDKMLRCWYNYCYDVRDEVAAELIYAQGAKMWADDGSQMIHRYRTNCVALAKDDFYSTFGGLFFVGILLSIVFVCAMTMIMYFKQVSEGYEDQARFEILKKVGMTDAEIRSNINSQILTVFFAPLVTAGIHCIFAFFPIWKILKLFGLTNLGFTVMVSLITYAVFSLGYVLIYKVTAGSYYSIVAKQER